MPTVAQRKRQKQASNKIERERAQSDIKPNIGIIAQLEMMASQVENSFRTSPPPLLERMQATGSITNEQLSAGQWYRSVFETYATHYPRITASYNPSGGGYDNDDTDKLSPISRDLGMLSGVLISVCIFDEEKPIELVALALDRARALQMMGR